MTRNHTDEVLVTIFPPFQYFLNSLDLFSKKVWSLGTDIDYLDFHAYFYINLYLDNP